MWRHEGSIPEIWVIQLSDEILTIQPPGILLQTTSSFTYLHWYSEEKKVNGLHLYSAFIQSAVQLMPLIHPFTHAFTDQRQLAAMQGNQPAHQEQLGVRCLAQGHFDTPRVGSNRQPSDCQTTALTS